ncbi:hypothetical protein Tco_0196024 [Tanacetum coccineum]
MIKLRALIVCNAVLCLESAARVKKSKKQKLNQEKHNEDPSTSTKELSAGSSGRKQLSATNIQNFNTPIVGKKKLNNGSQFSPVVFYGSPQGVPPKRPSRLLRLLHEIRVELAAQHKSREDIWATFPRQEEAMKYAKDHVGVRIFSYQDHVSGQRRFLVSTYKEFWRRYKNMNCKFRHHYEVIQECLSSLDVVLRLGVVYGGVAVCSGYLGVESSVVVGLGI